MALENPDITEHANKNLAAMDADFVRGGNRKTATLATLLTDFVNKTDQLKEGVTKVYVVSEGADYRLISIANIGNLATGWEKVETGGSGIQLYDPDKEYSKPDLVLFETTEGFICYYATDELPFSGEAPGTSEKWAVLNTAAFVSLFGDQEIDSNKRFKAGRALIFDEGAYFGFDATGGVDHQTVFFVDYLSTPRLLRGTFWEEGEAINPDNDFMRINLSTGVVNFLKGLKKNGVDVATVDDVASGASGFRNFSISVDQLNNVVFIPIQGVKVEIQSIDLITNIASVDQLVLVKGNVEGTVRSSVAALNTDIAGLTSGEIAAGYTIRFRAVLTAGKEYGTLIFRSNVI